MADGGGIQLLVSLPRGPSTHGGLSLALFGLASLPLAFERVCALPAGLPAALVSLALALLASGFDPARKNSALFLSLTLHFRAVLAEFDAQVRLGRVLLYELNDAVRTRACLLCVCVGGTDSEQR